MWGTDVLQGLSTAMVVNNIPLGEEIKSTEFEPTFPK